MICGFVCTFSHFKNDRLTSLFLLQSALFCFHRDIENLIHLFPWQSGPTTRIVLIHFLSIKGILRLDLNISGILLLRKIVFIYFFLDLELFGFTFCETFLSASAFVGENEEWWWCLLLSSIFFVSFLRRRCHFIQPAENASQR